MVRLLTGVGVDVEPLEATVERDVAVPMRSLFLSDVTLSRLVPIELTAAVTRCVAPSPMATTRMTTPTPMMMPSIVSAVRSLLLISPRNATRKHANRFIQLLSPVSNYENQQVFVSCAPTDYHSTLTDLGIGPDKPSDSEGE